HDEYWSGGERTNVETARDAGVNLAFFSGDVAWWKTRWESSIDGSGTSYRTLVCYKESYANAKIDPTPIWTGAWPDPRFSPPADGGRPENALTGGFSSVDGTINFDRNDPMTVPADDGRMRFWRNTSIASLPPGTAATLPAGVLGYEWDEDRDNGFRPAGLIRMSTSSFTDVRYLMNYSTVSGPEAKATHHLVMYRARSGALVFGSGTCQWSWGLDANHDLAGTPTDIRMQQATVNLFADMGVQPVTLRPGLVAATASTDHTPPTVTITSPTANSSVAGPITITGAATDAGGGVVGGVEVSVDGGQTWHPATTGRENWTYSWTPAAVGTVTILARAADDSCNLSAPSAPITVTVRQRTGMVSFWTSDVTPSMLTQDSTEPDPIEVGIKFSSDVNGTVTGLRFYKGSGNTGTHIGNLWTSGGGLLASAAFSGETSSGWQQVNFANPVPITAGATYIASYFAPNGHEAWDSFYTPYGNPPLHALAGVYAYGSSSLFPSIIDPDNSNFWVDIVFNTAPNTSPPVLQPIPDQTMSAGGSRTLTLQGSQPDGHPLTYSAQAFTQEYALRQKLGLSTDGDPTYDYNWGGRQEKWLTGSGGAWYFLLPSGELDRWDGSGTATGTKVAQLPVADYNDPRLLYNAQAMGVPSVQVTVSGSQLTITPNGYLGTFGVRATVSDGTQTADQWFLVIVLSTSPPPVLQPIPDQTMSAGGSRTLTLQGSQPDGHPLT
ncbi:MAG: DUF4082 domain-containing protein, partial [Isosphaeraceae bacterium]|nr:DUF4082 domain-containing protein [Isosphaeraceae bacterium]